MTKTYLCAIFMLIGITWEGYVTEEQIQEVNQILKDQGYSVQAKLIDTYAVGPEQMFEVLRSRQADVSFLTLNYLQMQGGKTAALLQPINTKSPRLSNYGKLNPALTGISMRLDRTGQPLYIPWGGGAYGIWYNADKVESSEVPSSVNDLFLDKWKGTLSLTNGQIQPNVALAALALGKKPFYLNELGRREVGAEIQENSEIQKKVKQLYSQVDSFWDVGPEFKDSQLFVASYGPGATAKNQDGGNWKLISFEEGNTIWLDTINFHKSLSGAKLEAAEIFANYWIGQKIQNTLVNDLGMVAASLEVANPLIDENPNFFKEDYFWPPYTSFADNAMHELSERAMKGL